MELNLPWQFGWMNIVRQCKYEAAQQAVFVK
jgi:hypothetical protein